MRGRAALALCVGLALVGCTPKRVSPPVELRADHEEPELIRVVHVVRPGQNLYRIAKAYGMSTDELMAANGISDPTQLSVGQELLIPGATETAEVEMPASLAGAGEGPKPGSGAGTGSGAGGGQGSGMTSGAGGSKGGTGGGATASSGTRPGGAPGKGTPAINVGNRPRPPDPEERAGPPDPRKGTLDWPLRGVLYGRFGKKGKEPHDGVDLAAPAGTPVKTAAEGQVLYAGEQKGYGKIVIVEHGNELVTLYAHNRDLRVKSGQKVRKGQVVATVGESGRTSGPHLHFEVRKNGRPIDPLTFLGPVPRK